MDDESLFTASARGLSSESTTLEHHDSPGAVRRNYFRTSSISWPHEGVASDSGKVSPTTQLPFSGDALIITDAKGIIEHLNPAAEQLTGWTQTNVYGMPVTKVFDLVDEQTEEPALYHICQCLAEGHVTALTSHTILRSRSGHKQAVQSSVAPVRGRNGELNGAMIIFKDVTQERHLAREMIHHATHDALTGVVNRREFEQRLQHAIKGGRERVGQHVLCYLDLDRFKKVNDVAGHAAGDLMLKQVTEALLSKLRDRDTLARLGGDEFGLLLDNCPTDKGVEIAQTLIATIRETRFTSNGHDFQIGVSIGLVEINAASGTTMQLMSQADSACYKAKHNGRNQVSIFNRESQGLDQHHFEGVSAGTAWKTL